jgi:hypothetical protein
MLDWMIEILGFICVELRQDPKEDALKPKI